MEWDLPVQIPCMPPKKSYLPQKILIPETFLEIVFTQSETNNIVDHAGLSDHQKHFLIGSALLLMAQ